LIFSQGGDRVPIHYCNETFEKYSILFKIKEDDPPKIGGGLTAGIH
jgi:hypothetical protein